MAALSKATDVHMDVYNSMRIRIAQNLLTTHIRGGNKKETIMKAQFAPAYTCRYVECTQIIDPGGPDHSAVVQAPSK